MNAKSFVILLLVLSVSFVIFPKIRVKAESETIVVPDNYFSVFDAVGNASEGDTIFVKNGIYNIEGHSGVFYLDFSPTPVDDYSFIIEQNINSIPEFPSWICII